MASEISELEREFLKESNAIEDVWDDESLEKAIEAWLYIRDQPRLHSSNIKKTHRILMEGKLDKKDLGHWRLRPVWIAGREGMPYWVLRDAMKYWYLTANKPMAWEQIREHHITYERIHPFIDGNGRTGRIFMNWQRIKNGLPVLVVPERTKYVDYYKWFK